MKKKICIIVILAMCIAVICVALLFIKKSENSMENNTNIQIIRKDSTDIESYSKQVYLNGVEIKNKDAVILVDDIIYVSIDMLNEQVSREFIVYKDKHLSIRRNTIDSAIILQAEQNSYLSWKLLSQYIQSNKDVQEDVGLYLDTMMLNSISYKNTRYMLTQETMDVNQVSGEPDSVTADGRGIWEDEKDIWIEDDWNRLYKYEKSAVSIA